MVQQPTEPKIPKLEQCQVPRWLAWRMRDGQ